MKLFEAQNEALYAGRVPRAKLVNGEIKIDGAVETVLTVPKLCNDFLNTKWVHRLDLGKKTQRSFDEYTATAKRLTEVLGKDTAVEDLMPRDFNRLLTTITAGGGKPRYLGADPNGERDHASEGHRQVRSRQRRHFEARPLRLRVQEARLRRDPKRLE